ncbi:MAG: sugar transferase [Chloroflexota bacterium]
MERGVNFTITNGNNPQFTHENRQAYFFIKRLVDLAVSSIGLILLSPVMLVIYVLIRTDSPGSPIYVQERVGTELKKVNGKTVWVQKNFNMYKFRTMRQNSSSQIHQKFIEAYIAGDEDEMARLQQKKANEKSKFKLNGDPRITKIGQFLRKTSLDELPQLINVLTGDMTLVGPRPPIPYEVALYRPYHFKRLNTKQGITGYWQVNGRNSTSFEEMVSLDAEYITKQSFWLDVKILVKTFTEVFYKQETT